MRAKKTIVAAIVCVSLVVAAIGCFSLASVASADVFNMGGTRNPDGAWTGLATLEAVPVGNVGNPGDFDVSGGFGGVDYAYNIGKYEVTNVVLPVKQDTFMRRRG